MKVMSGIDALFEREYVRLVRSLAVAFDPESAADAVQEAFIVADQQLTISAPQTACGFRWVFSALPQIQTGLFAGLRCLSVWNTDLRFRQRSSLIL